MQNVVDKRVLPFRDGLAAVHLRGSAGINARFYVEGSAARVKKPQIFLHEEPDPRSSRVSMLNLNEKAVLYPHRSSWVMVQCEHDSYVGFARTEDFNLSERPAPVLTHRVTALSALVYAGPSHTLPTFERLGLWTEVHVARLQNGFSEIPGVGWVKEDTLLPLHRGFFEEKELDYVGPATAAYKMLGVPYVWAARSTALGLDCSALVQLGFHALGRKVPRDADMQMSLGKEAEVPKPGELGSWTRDQLLFWEGHVAISLGRDYVVHASGNAGRVITERYENVVDERGLPIVARDVN